MDGMNIELHIEELVLHGFAPKDKDQIQRAIKFHLRQLLIEREIPDQFSQAREVQQVDGGVFELKTGIELDDIGKKVAQRIIEGGETNENLD